MLGVGLFFLLFFKTVSPFVPLVVLENDFTGVVLQSPALFGRDPLVVQLAAHLVGHHKLAGGIRGGRPAFVHFVQQHPIDAAVPIFRGSGDSTTPFESQHAKALQSEEFVENTGAFGRQQVRQNDFGFDGVGFLGGIFLTQGFHKVIGQQKP